MTSWPAREPTMSPAPGRAGTSRPGRSREIRAEDRFRSTPARSAPVARFRPRRSTDGSARPGRAEPSVDHDSGQTAPVVASRLAPVVLRRRDAAVRRRGHCPVGEEPVTAGPPSAARVHEFRVTSDRVGDVLRRPMRPLRSDPSLPGGRAEPSERVSRSPSDVTSAASASSARRSLAPHRAVSEPSAAGPQCNCRTLDRWGQPRQDAS